MFGVCTCWRALLQEHDNISAALKSERQEFIRIKQDLLADIFLNLLLERQGF